MDITTNRVDAMNHYGIAREAAAIYSLDVGSSGRRASAATRGHFAAASFDRGA